MKLYHWCMKEKLYDEAQEQIATLKRLSPGLERVEALEFQLQALRERPPEVDQGVVRTSVDQPEPAMLNSDRLRELRDAAQRSPLPPGMPVIPGMPQVQSVKRFGEFREFVHRALQQKCARCHNEEQGTQFQMVWARTRNDLLNEHVVRANFDEVLRLINFREPLQSELLTRSISPHPPDNRPILTGPNDPTYRLLAYWVNGMKSETASVTGGVDDRSAETAQNTAAAAPPTAMVPAPPAASAVGGFAADRGPSAPPALTPTPPSGAPATGPANGVVAPNTYQAPLTEAPNTAALPGGQVGVLEAAQAGQMLPGGARPRCRTCLPPRSFRPRPWWAATRR